MDDRSKEITHWADDAMYEAQPMLRKEGARVKPRVFLLNATPDPLGTCAADMRMYRGDPVYSLDEITDEERTWAWDELSKTHLNTPLEGVSLKFMIEAVTRSFTHQMVRQRVGAYYVQESLRFAVKRGIAQEVALPPTIMNDDAQVDVPSAIWHDTIELIEKAYNQLVDAGIPAEDARGLLPHAVTTRIIYHTNLRALFEHAGNRLCTQAQFEWRHVFMEVMKAIAGHATTTQEEVEYQGRGSADDWQWQLIAQPRPHTFTPICYRLGKCAFMSELDRGCTIRDRVQAFHAAGVSSDRWEAGHSDRYLGEVVPDTGGERVEGGRWIPGISPAEWMANPWAGVTTEHNERPT